MSENPLIIGVDIPISATAVADQVYRDYRDGLVTWEEGRSALLVDAALNLFGQREGIVEG